jgi:hypothetical protein
MDANYGLQRLPWENRSALQAQYTLSLLLFVLLKKIAGKVLKSDI